MPLTSEMYLSKGAPPGIFNAKVDLADIWVKDMANDPVYQSLIQNGSSNTYLHMNLGMS